MTAAPPDCDPRWTDGEPTDRTPTPFDLRAHEIRDCRGQHAQPVELWGATTLNPQEHL